MAGQITRSSPLAIPPAGQKTAIWLDSSSHWGH